MQTKREQIEFAEKWPSLWAILAGHPKIRAAYPDASSVALGMSAYREVLRDLPVDAVRSAIVQALASCEWFPTPAEIRRVAARLVSGPEPTPLEAYGAAIRELSDARSQNRTARIADPVAREVVSLLGGGYYLLSSPDQMADRAHFLREYERLAAKRRQEGEILPQARAELGQVPVRRVESRPALQLVAPREPVETPEEREARREELQTEVAALLGKFWPNAARPSATTREGGGFRRVDRITPASEPVSRDCRLCGSRLPDDDSGCATCRMRAEARRRELLAQAERLAESGETA